MLGIFRWEDPIHIFYLASTRAYIYPPSKRISSPFTVFVSSLSRFDDSVEKESALESLRHARREGHPPSRIRLPSRSRERLCTQRFPPCGSHALIVINLSFPPILVFLSFKTTRISATRDRPPTKPKGHHLRTGEASSQNCWGAAGEGINIKWYHR